MNEVQKKKRKLRASKRWKLKKLSERKRAGNQDEITLKPLRKGWQLHHQNLDDEKYCDLSQPFLCCNNLTHKFIHWLFVYYVKDPQILDRIKYEMEVMRALNEKGNKE